MHPDYRPSPIYRRSGITCGQNILPVKFWPGFIFVAVTTRRNKLLIAPFRRRLHDIVFTEFVLNSLPIRFPSALIRSVYIQDAIFAVNIQILTTRDTLGFPWKLHETII